MTTFDKTKDMAFQKHYGKRKKWLPAFSRLPTM